MKHLLPLYFFLLIIMTGCQDSLIDKAELPVESPTAVMANQLQPRLLTRSKNELNVRYVAGLPEAIKDTIRSHFGVIETRTCHCSDKTLENWLLSDTSTFSIEEIKEELSTSGQGLEGSDFEYALNLPNSNDQQLEISIDRFLSKLSYQSEGVTIAVVDSGIDFNLPDELISSLYNSQLMDDYCDEDGMTEISGWDFVHGDNIPEDQNGHGTAVTGLIVENLMELGIPFQILPIKAFDANGEGSYFDIMCATNFALLKQNVKVVNLSFGGLGANLHMLGDIIASAEEDIIVVTSAGNTGTNNDQIPHYPSSCQSENVLSVASLNQFHNGLASFSNIGANEVDIAAPGENLSFNNHLISGTSFSSALVSAKLAEAVYNNPGSTPHTVIDLFINGPDCVYQNYLINKIKYPKMVMIQ